MTRFALCLSAVQGIVHTPERFEKGSNVWLARRKNAKAKGDAAWKRFVIKAQKYEDKLKREGKSLDLRKNKVPTSD